MKKKTLIVSATTLILVIAAFASYAGLVWYRDHRAPAFAKGGVIRVYPNTSAEDLIRILTDKCGVLYPRSLERAFRRENVARRLCSGSYVIEPGFSAIYVARVFTHGWQSPVNLTISGRIHSVEDIAGIIGRQMMADSASVLTVLRDSVLLDKFGTSPSHVFEMIIPDTYQMYWNTPADEILERLYKEHDVFWNEERKQAAAKQGLSPEQVSVLASIVSEETHRKDEFPKIASVYLTRLRRGMKLQACPTVCYLYGYKIRRVLFRHLKTDSPYNTYLYEGLPPTPIALPSKEHLEAVLHPDATPYLFFCADSSFNGCNVFSETLAQHTARAQEYRIAIAALEARKAAKAAAEAEAAKAKADSLASAMAEPSEVQASTL